MFWIFYPRKANFVLHGQYKLEKILGNLKKTTALYKMQYLPFYVNGAGLKDIYETGYAEMYNYRPVQKCDYTCTKAINVIFQFNRLKD